MESISIYEAKSRLSALVKRAEAGQEVTNTRRGRPVAKLVPALCEVEFANVMTVLLRRGALARHLALAILSRIERLALAVDRAAVPPRTPFELCNRHGISAYDAAYLELAVRRSLPLATRGAHITRGRARRACSWPDPPRGDKR